MIRLRPEPWETRLSPHNGLVITYVLCSLPGLGCTGARSHGRPHFPAQRRLWPIRPRAHHMILSYSGRYYPDISRNIRNLRIHRDIVYSLSRKSQDKRQLVPVHSNDHSITNRPVPALTLHLSHLITLAIVPPPCRNPSSTPCLTPSNSIRLWSRSPERATRRKMCPPPSRTSEVVSPLSKRVGCEP